MIEQICKKKKLHISYRDIYYIATKTYYRKNLLCIKIRSKISKLKKKYLNHSNSKMPLQQVLVYVCGKRFPKNLRKLIKHFDLEKYFKVYKECLLALIFITSQVSISLSLSLSSHFLYWVV